ncbi:MAG: hypothetical protein ABH881_01320, partial [bacterium]
MRNMFVAATMVAVLSFSGLALAQTSAPTEEYIVEMEVVRPEGKSFRTYKVKRNGDLCKVVKSQVKGANDATCKQVADYNGLDEQVSRGQKVLLPANRIRISKQRRSMVNPTTVPFEEAVKISVKKFAEMIAVSDRNGNFKVVDQERLTADLIAAMENPQGEVELSGQLVMVGTFKDKAQGWTLVVAEGVAGKYVDLSVHKDTENGEEYFLRMIYVEQCH